MKKISLMLWILASLVSTLSFITAHTIEEESARYEGCGMISGMFGMMGGSWGMGGMFFSWIIGLLVIVALILLIVWLIKQIQKK